MTCEVSSDIFVGVSNNDCNVKHIGKLRMTRTRMNLSLTEVLVFEVWKVKSVGRPIFWVPCGEGADHVGVWVLDAANVLSHAQEARTSSQCYPCEKLNIVEL